jgi:hypothetical protein
MPCYSEPHSYCHHENNECVEIKNDKYIKSAIDKLTDMLCKTLREIECQKLSIDLDDDIKIINSSLYNVQETILRLEDKIINEFNEKLNTLHLILKDLKFKYEIFVQTQYPEVLKEKIDSLERSFGLLTSKFITKDDMINSLESNSKKPHRCPVCDGKGIEFDKLGRGEGWNSSCRACEGKRIVWG